jgi:alanine racemase
MTMETHSRNSLIKDKRFAWAEINLENLSHNIEIIRSYLDSESTGIMAVVKADAYGHGAVEVSKQAVKSGVNALGVALVEEGVELRKAGIDKPIYVLGESPAETIGEAVENHLVLCINSYESAQFISKECAKAGKEITVNLNVDTGMNRIGVNFNGATGQISKILSLPNLKFDSVSTHYACAGSSDGSYTELQWKRFNEIIKHIKDRKTSIRFYHCANSAAFFRYKNMHIDMVRIGISLYGLNPYGKNYYDWLSPDAVDAVSKLKPVYSLKTRITFIKKVLKGMTVSYCGTFKTQRDSVIATVPVGYADGYSRLLSNKAIVLIKGKPAPVVGNVTMDQFMIDVTDIAKIDGVSVGDEVILIGEYKGHRITAEDLAKLIGTINYEVVCMFKNRIPRILI